LDFFETPRSHFKIALLKLSGEILFTRLDRRAVLDEPCSTANFIYGPYPIYWAEFPLLHIDIEKIILVDRYLRDLLGLSSVLMGLVSAPFVFDIENILEGDFYGLRILVRKRDKLFGGWKGFRSVPLLLQ
jgi:hypothetical protein